MLKKNHQQVSRLNMHKLNPDDVYMYTKRQDKHNWLAEHNKSCIKVRFFCKSFQRWRQTYRSPPVVHCCCLILSYFGLIEGHCSLSPQVYRSQVSRYKKASNSQALLLPEKPHDCEARRPVDSVLAISYRRPRL